MSEYLLDGSTASRAFFDSRREDIKGFARWQEEIFSDMAVYRALLMRLMHAAGGLGIDEAASSTTTQPKSVLLGAIKNRQTIKIQQSNAVPIPPGQPDLGEAANLAVRHVTSTTHFGLQAALLDKPAERDDILIVNTDLPADKQEVVGLYATDFRPEGTRLDLLSDRVKRVGRLAVAMTELSGAGFPVYASHSEPVLLSQRLDKNY